MDPKTVDFIPSLVAIHKDLQQICLTSPQSASNSKLLPLDFVGLPYRTLITAFSAPSMSKRNGPLSVHIKMPNMPHNIWADRIHITCGHLRFPAAMYATASLPIAPLLLLLQYLLVLLPQTPTYHPMSRLPMLHLTPPAAVVHHLTCCTHLASLPHL